MTRAETMTALRAGLSYFALIFAAGFMLGTLRVLVLEPALGRQIAVVIELPVMLALSWWAAGFLTRGKDRLGTPTARLKMGATGFVLLIAGEIGLTLILGGTLSSFASELFTPPGLTGLSGQVVFALTPWLRLLITRRQTG